MANKFLNAAWSGSRDIKGATLTVFLRLCDRAGEKTQQAWPSRQNLADECRVTPRTVQRAIAELEAKGYLERIENPRGGRGRTVTFVVNTTPKRETRMSPFIEETETPMSPFTKLKGRHLEHERETFETLKGDICDNHTYMEPKRTSMNPNTLTHTREAAASAIADDESLDAAPDKAEVGDIDVVDPMVGPEAAQQAESAGGAVEVLEPVSAPCALRNPLLPTGGPLVMRQAVFGSITPLPQMDGLPFEWLVVAQKRGLDDGRAQHEFEKFCAHYRGTGEGRARWDSVWDKWLLGMKKYENSAKGTQNGNQSSNHFHATSNRAARQAEAADDAWDAALAGLQLTRAGGGDMGQAADGKPTGKAGGW